jgi:hypothetical protein
MRINIITKQEYQELMKTFDTSKQFTPDQLDCFIVEEINHGHISYLVIDNRSGKFWAEEFHTLRKCIDYLNGADLDELYNF